MTDQPPPASTPGVDVPKPVDAAPDPSAGSAPNPNVGPAPDESLASAPDPSLAPAFDPTAPPVSTHEPLAKKRSRVGGVWVAAVAFAVILLLLLIFVLENGQKAEISFFGQHGHLPQGVALLLAAVFGILLVAIPGSVRIIQFRMRERQHRRSH
jgi:uncharacterized integral membrane protein